MQQLIGKGTFTTAYRSGSNTVLLKSCDPVKESMALGFFPCSKLFPTIQRVSLCDKDGYQWYKMKYYPRVKSPKQQLNSKHYQLYQELRSVYRWYYKTIHLENGFKTSISDKVVGQYLVEAINACKLYTSAPNDVRFEISPRNISCTPSGRLILLDCFFLKSALLRYG